MEHLFNYFYRIYRIPEIKFDFLEDKVQSRNYANYLWPAYHKRVELTLIIQTVLETNQM